jgi:hypothetical protein
VRLYPNFSIVLVNNSYITAAETQVSPAEDEQRRQFAPYFERWGKAKAT